MLISILHISDLHRDLKDEVDNVALIETIARDIQKFDEQEPRIPKPTLCIVSGDLVYGVHPARPDRVSELERQCDQAKEFLVGLADRFFDGIRERVVLLPGNHDVSYDVVMQAAEKLEIPNESEKKKSLVSELFAPTSKLRWSWSELCFYRIINEPLYLSRLKSFGSIYQSFYQDKRTFSLMPEEQFGIFDFPELCLSVLTLNSCFRNDPLQRAGAFNPRSVIAASKEAIDPKRSGWLIAAAWHHNLAGAPMQTDYMDPQVLQVLIDSGVSVGFHGHQHLPECVEERYRVGPSARKMTIVSAGTLCAGPEKLSPGTPRSFNVVELNTDDWTGRVHQRRMTNLQFSLPIWGPGFFTTTNRSYIDFDICKPLMPRPPQLDEVLILEHAESLLGRSEWANAADILISVKTNELARPLLLRALVELGEARRIIAGLWPPLSNAEAVTLGGAILESGTDAEAEAYLRLEIVKGGADASVAEISKRISNRISK